MKPTTRHIVLAFLLAGLMPCTLAGCREDPPPRPLSAPAARPAARTIAGPVPVEGVTIENFGVVDEGRLYRGSVPSAAQVDELARLGVRTVVDLQMHPEADVRARAGRLKIRFVSIPMRKRQTPTDESVTQFLDVATDPARQPVYVYCKAGVHRTGSLVAVYRIAVDGWTSNDATKEMDAFGFDSLFGLQDGFRAYVVEYERRLKADPTSVPRPVPAGDVAK